MVLRVARIHACAGDRYLPSLHTPTHGAFVRRHLLRTAAMLVLAAPLPGLQGQQTGAVDAQRTATALIESLQSPFCPGLTLPACPSWHADTLRQALRRRVLAGESPAALRREMAARYGQYVRGEPTWHGFDVLGWLGPGALLLLAGGVLWRVLGRRRARASGESPGRPAYVPPLVPLEAEEQARLEARLAEELHRS